MLKKHEKIWKKLEEDEIWCIWIQNPTKIVRLEDSKNLKKRLKTKNQGFEIQYAEFITESFQYLILL
jgi:hypothetical protein